MVMHGIDHSEQHYKDLRERLDPFFADILQQIHDYNPGYNRELVQRAYEFGLWAHREQVRKSGEPYFEHCLHVSLLLTELRMDSVTIAAALLHDVVEDTGYTREDIADGFGADVALLVDGVTKITEVSGIKNLGYEMRQAETFRKMLLSMAKDVRVIIIKFADRLHNMRTLQHVPAKNRIRISIETRDVYAPLAHRFGMARLKGELEDLAFKYIDNKAYLELAERLNQKREAREAYIRSIVEPIKRDLDEHKIKADLFGRPKHIFSIYRKMNLRNKPFEEIYDLSAIRIIVDKVEECYYVLGIVHNCFTPVYERFKDYIAMPKFNGYQSLHTTVVDREGHMVEIQIRTQEMHRIAEMGIAAHWLYKDAGSEKKQSDMEKRLDWVRQLLDQYKENEAVDAQDFLESLKINLYQDEVFVFTPKGDVHRLPLGSTPVDFAFAVHSNVGMNCIGAKVNGKMVPLKHQLNSGESVEIITSGNQRPSQDWLTFVKSSKARHHVRRFLREVQFDHSVKLGEEIISKYSNRYKVKLDEATLEDAAKKLNFDNVGNLKAAVGRGEVTFEKVVSVVSDEPVVEKRISFFPKVLQRHKNYYTVHVQDMDNVMINLGKCCHPVPGDEIIGYITRGRGVTIHRGNCPNMQSLVDAKDRTMRVNWTVEVEETFHVQISLLGEDRKNLLRDIAQAIANTNTNILNFEIKTRDKLGIGKLFVEVRNLPHLTRVINAINQVKGIISVERVESGLQK